MLNVRKKSIVAGKRQSHLPMVKLAGSTFLRGVANTARLDQKTSTLGFSVSKSSAFVF